MSHPLDVSTARRWAAVTPSDSVNFTEEPRALFVGTGGNLSLRGGGGTSVTFLNVPSGTVLPIAPKRVNATSTTATDIVALY